MTFTHAPYNYYLGPWQPSPDASMRGWIAPQGTVGLIDLASLPEISGAGSPRKMGFFATTQTLDSSYAILGTGDCREISTTTAMQSAWKSQTGYHPQGATLLDLLWDQLTNGADPSGQSAVRPLMPDANLNLELYLGGHSLVKSEQFVFGRHSLTQKVIAVLQGDYAGWYDAGQKGHSKPDQHLKCLDFLGDKFGLPDPENYFIPKNLPKEKPVKHDTTINDTFNRANQSGLGTASDGFTWTALSNVKLGIVSNQASYPSGTTGEDLERANQDLSSADHYSQASAATAGTSTTPGMIGRKDSSATKTYYLADCQNNITLRIFKCVANTFTELQFASGSLSIADVLQLKCNGSTITNNVNGVTKVTASDTSITGNLRAGMRWDSSTAAAAYAVDNWQAADIGGGVTYFQQHQLMSGGSMQRSGIYFTGGL